MFSVWSIVRQDMPTEERERKRNGGRMYAYNMYGDLYDRMHTKIRYTEGLGSVSPLLFAQRERVVICFFPEVIIAEDSHFESSQQHEVIVRQWRSMRGSACKVSANIFYHPDRSSGENYV